MNIGDRLNKLESATTPATCPRCGQSLCGAAAQRERQQAAAEKKLFDGNEFARQFAELLAGDSPPGVEDGQK
ncbi:MAG: hypothetical protein ABSB74_15915 [Tepidisphaeraceae bacterium]